MSSPFASRGVNYMVKGVLALLGLAVAAGGAVTVNNVYNYSTWTTYDEISTPGSNPAANKVHVYLKGDGALHALDENGDETAIGGGATHYAKLSDSFSINGDLASQLSERIFVESFADLSAWTVAGDPTNGTASVSGGVLTIDDTSGSGTISVTTTNEVLKDNVRPYTIEMIVSHDSAVKLRCSVITGTSGVVAHVELENNTIKALIEDDGGYPTPTTVTPTDYEKSNKSRLMFFVDPLVKNFAIYLYYEDNTGGDDQFVKLAENTYTNEIDKIQFLTGGSSTGACTIQDIRVYEVWAVMIGDSIAAGHPDYDPVFSFYATQDETSQVAYWLEQQAGGVRRCLNQGKGGDGSANVVTRNSDWVVNLKPLHAIYWFGSNDMSGSMATLQANTLTVWDETIAAGINVIHLETMPRDLLSAEAKANILTHNAWLHEAAKGRNVRIVPVYDLLEDPDNAGFIHPDLTDDDVHLNSKGYRLAARAVWRAMADFKR